MPSQIRQPYNFFTDAAGHAIEYGLVYIGKAGLEPSSHDIPIYWDPNLTVPAKQPLEIKDGLLSRDGSPGVVFTPEPDYSIKVVDKSGNVIYSELHASLVNGQVIATGYIKIVDSIAALRNEEPVYDGQEVELLGHSVPGKGGGTFFYDASDTSSSDDNGTVIVTPSGARWKRKVASYITPYDFGASGIAGVDDYAALKSAMLATYPLLIPHGTFEMSGWLPVPSNKVVKFDGWLKVVNPVPQYEAALTMSTQLNGFQSKDVVIINPQIDMNYAPAGNGIIFRDGTENVRVIGGRIKNCAHDKNGYGGGRAFNVEAGTSDVSIPSNIQVTGATIENCYQAINVAGNQDSKEKNIIFSGILAYNCEILIGLSGNSVGFPHSGDIAGCFISGVTAFNVGNSTTYARPHGIINSNRGCNAVITDIKVYNDATYSTSGNGVGSVFMGEAANVTLDNIDVDGDLIDVVNINSYAEVDALPVYKYGSRGLRFRITHRGVTQNTINYAYTYDPTLTETEGDSNPSNCVFDIDTEQVASDLPLPATVASYPSLYVKLREVTNNAYWEGFAEQLQSEKFSNFSNAKYFGAPITISDGANNRSGGLSIRSFAPVLRFKDLSTSAHWWEAYVDGNLFHMGISVDSGATWNEYFTFAPNYFKPFNTNSVDLGQSGVSSWRNLFVQNPVTVTSDARTKKNVINENLGLDFIMKLRPVQYNHVDDDGHVHHGLIAQELRDVLRGFGLSNTIYDDPEVGYMSIRYEELIPIIIKAIQEMVRRGSNDN